MLRNTLCNRKRSLWHYWLMEPSLSWGLFFFQLLTLLSFRYRLNIHSLPHPFILHSLSPSLSSTWNFSKWGYSCFTRLCWLLLYNKVNQPYVLIPVGSRVRHYWHICIYITAPSWSSLPAPQSQPSRSPQSTELHPCAMQQVPISYLFYPW